MQSDEPVPQQVIVKQTHREYFSCDEKRQQMGIGLAHPERLIPRGNPPKFPQFLFEIVSHLLPVNFLW